MFICYFPAIDQLVKITFTCKYLKSAAKHFKYKELNAEGERKVEDAEFYLFKDNGRGAFGLYSALSDEKKKYILDVKVLHVAHSC